MPVTISQLTIEILGNARNFQSAINLTDREIARLDAQVGRASSRMSANLITTGRILTAHLTAPIVLAGAAAIKTAAEFDTSMTKLISLVGISRKEVATLRDEVKGLARDVAINPSELASGLYFIMSSGIEDTASAMDVLTQSAKAAASGLGETQQIADLVTSAMNAYGHSNIDATRTLDILIAAVKEGKAEAQDMAGALGKVLPIAAAIGVKFEEVAGAVAAMTRLGLDANESVTALRRIFTQFIKPAKESVELIESVGLSYAGLRKELDEDLLGALFHLKDAFNGNIEAMARAFPNVRALVGVLNLLGENADEARRIFDEVVYSAGSLDEAFKETQQTLGYKLNRAVAQIQTSFIEFGDAVAPIIDVVSEKIRELTEWFNGLSDEQTRAIANALLLTAALGPVALWLGALANAIKITVDTGILLRAALLGIRTQLAATAVQAEATTLTLSQLNAQLDGIAVSSAAARGGLMSLLGPLSIGIAITTALWYSFNRLAKEGEEYNETLWNEIHMQSKAADEAAQRAKTVYDLTQQLQNLNSIENKNDSDLKKIQVTMNKIAQLAPNLVLAYDSQGNAIKLMGDNALIAANKLKQLNKESLNLHIKDTLGRELDKLSTERDKLEKALEPENAAKTYGFYSEGNAENERRADQITQSITDRITNIKRRMEQIRHEMGRLYHPIAEEITKEPFDIGEYDFGTDKADEATKALKRLRDAYQSLMQSLDLGIWTALKGDTEAVRLEYELTYGELKNLSEAEKQAARDKRGLLDSFLEFIDMANEYQNVTGDLQNELNELYGVEAKHPAILAIETGKLKNLGDEQKDEIRRNVALIPQLKLQNELRERGNQIISDSKKYLHDLTDTKSLGELGKALDYIYENGLWDLNPELAQTILDAANAKDIANSISDLDDAYDSLKKNLEEQLNKTEDLSTVQMIENELLKAKYVDLSPERKKALLDIAAEVDANKANNEALNEQARKIKAVEQAYRNHMQSIEERLLAIEYTGDELKIQLLMLQEGFTRVQAEAIVAFDNYVSGLERIQKETEKYAEMLSDTLEDALGKILDEGFKDFWNNVIDGFRQMFRQIVIDYIKSQAYKFFLRIGGMLAGASTGGAGGAGGSNGNIGLLAGGGPAVSNSPYIVGEEGPELFIPDSSGFVVSNRNLLDIPDMLTSMFSNSVNASENSKMFISGRNLVSSPSSINSGSNTVVNNSDQGDTYNININLPNIKDTDKFRSSRGQIMEELHQEMIRASRRNRRVR